MAEYLSKKAKYELFNFQDSIDIERIANTISDRGSDCPVFLLNGDTGVGRDYFLQSVIYTLQRLYPKQNYDYAILDLNGFETSNVGEGIEEFAKMQLDRYGEEYKKEILDEIIRIKPTEKPTTILDGISLSVLPHISITAKAVQEIFQFKNYEKYKAPDKEGKAQFHELINRVCHGRKLLLHVIHPEFLDVVTQRWLFDETRITKNLILAFSVNSRNSVPKEYCDKWKIEKREIELNPLSLPELTDRIDTRFGGNNFNSEFIELLFRISRGYTKTLAILFKNLLEEDCLLEKNDCWILTDNINKITHCLSSYLYDPLEEILHDPSNEYGPQIYEFLCLMTLCGGFGPADLFFDYMGLDDDQQERIDDVIDERLVYTDSPLLIDHGYNHPSFPNHFVYSFKNSYYISLFLGKQDKVDKKSRACSLFDHLKDRLTIDTKAKAALLLMLATIGNLPYDIEQYDLALQWWVDKIHTDDFKVILIEMMRDGSLNPTSLWNFIDRNERKLSPIRMLALLDAYREQPDGVPMDKFGHFILKRSGILYNLSWYSEALEDLYDADELGNGFGLHLKGAIKSMIGLCLFALGFHNKALPYLKQALDIIKEYLGEDHPDVAASLNNLAKLLQAQGKYPDAEPLYRRALEIREARLGADHPDVAHSLNDLAGLLHDQGKYPDAEPLYRRALEIREARLGADHPDVAASLNNLAGLIQTQGKYPDAEPLYRRALEILETQLGADHPDVAHSLNNLAGLLHDQGKYPDAEPLYRRALEIREARLGADHPVVATSLNNLAGLLQAQGKYPDAELLYRRALEILETQLGADHPDVATSLNNLALLLKAQGKYPDAELLYRRALEILETQLGADHPDVATSLNNLAGLLQAQGKYPDAEPLYRRALEILETQLGADHPNTNTLRNNLENLIGEIYSNNRDK